MDITIRYLVIDVDGVMTDAGIYYDDQGNELKKFCTKDAAGFFVAKEAGIKTIVLTGRECAATTRRMSEMKVDLLVQNIKNKRKWLSEFMKENNIPRKEVGYIGDDLNDLAAMKIAGFKACPSDSCREIKEITDYISPIPGGHGVIRDVVEYILNAAGIWENSLAKVYNYGI